jgi:peroxiredoxin
MKKKLLNLMLLALVGPLYTFAQAQEYFISGTIGNINAPAKAYLFVDGHIDSTVLQNGSFKFRGAIDEAKPASLTINNLGTGPLVDQAGASLYTLFFYVEPGATRIISPDSLYKAKISGGPLNTDYAKLQGLLNPTMEALTRCMINANEVSDETRKSASFKEKYKKEMDSIEKEQKRIYLDFIHKNPNAVMSLFLLQAYAGFSSSQLPNIMTKKPVIAEVESLYASLSKNIRLSKPGVEFINAVEMEKYVKIGGQAPAFSQTDTAGKVISLQDFKGKYVLLEFWASWCGPCRTESPNLVRIYEKYNVKGFTILGVSLNSATEKEQWLKAIKTDHLTWAQVSDLKGLKNEIALLYGVRGIPTNFLVDPSGKVVAKNLFGVALETKLKELIK